MSTLRAIQGTTRVRHDAVLPKIRLPKLAEGEYVVRLDMTDDRYGHASSLKTYNLRWTIWVVSP